MIARHAKRADGHCMGRDFAARAVSRGVARHATQTQAGTCVSMRPVWGTEFKATVHARGTFYRCGAQHLRRQSTRAVLLPVWYLSRHCCAPFHCVRDGAPHGCAPPSSEPGTKLPDRSNKHHNQTRPFSILSVRVRLGTGMEPSYDRHWDDIQCQLLKQYKIF